MKADYAGEQVEIGQEEEGELTKSEEGVEN